MVNPHVKLASKAEHKVILTIKVHLSKENKFEHKNKLVLSQITQLKYKGYS